MLSPAPQGTQVQNFSSAKASWAINSRGRGSNSALISAAGTEELRSSGPILGEERLFVGNLSLFNKILSRRGFKLFPWWPTLLANTNPRSHLLQGGRESSVI